MPPDIPGAKRAGLPVDLDRLTAEGDEWLSPEERYALMVRIRVGGVLDSDAARGLARIADEYAGGWIHLTTRQQVQLHHVHARDVTTVLGQIRRLGLTTRSTCGHTMRGVMSCPDAGVGLEEPFDCYPDARMMQDSILSRTPGLDTKMPQRINVAFGGCAACRDHARVNDLSFVSVVTPEGELGYECWIGGSLGKSTTMLAFKAIDFVPRAEVLAAGNALFNVHIEQPVSTPLSSSIAAVLARAPEGGWGSGVRPQRVPGWAMVTVNVPLGDLDSDDFRELAALADTVGDEHIYFTRNQNAMFRHVRIEEVPFVRTTLAALGLGLEDADQARDVRVCTGGPVCSLALTPAPRLGAELIHHPALARNAGLRVHISGCPNSCAQHQIADVGFSGGRVTIAGSSMLGYQVWLGGDLRAGTIAQVVGRVADSDVSAILSAIVGVWEALRERRETLSDTVARYGIEAFQAQIAAVFHGRWEPGPEPESIVVPESLLVSDSRVPMVVGA